MNLSAGTYTLYTISASEAVFLRSPLLEPEHFFLGLLKLEDVLRHGAFPPDMDKNQIEEATREIARLVEVWSAKGVSAKDMRRRLRFLLNESLAETGEFGGHRSQRGRDLFERAEKLCEEAGKSQLELYEMLQACLQTESAILKTLFEEYSIDPEIWLKEGDLPEWLQQLENGAKEEESVGHTPEEDNASRDHPLAKYGRDLTALAREGKLGPIIGRNEEIKNIARILSQRTRNNPILLGDPGVGKTAVVEGLAVYAASENAIAPIRDMRFVEITMSALVAGTKYRGDFEGKLQNVLDTARSDPNLVLFIDELHTMMGAGGGEGTMDAANILKPALSRGDVRCVGATTTPEYRKFIEPDGALTRRFQIVWIDEPAYQDTLAILRGLRHKLEKHHGLKIPDDAMEKAVAFSSRYITDGYQPDKAIMVLDEACALFRLKTLSPTPAEQAMEIGVEEVAQVVARRTQIPLEVILVRDEERLLTLEKELGKRVIGQDQAIASVAKAIRIARAGLRARNRPVVLLFAGPTGTGKSELAKAISKFLYLDEKRLITLDMTEFQEQHSVAKIVGSPPGYVGFGEEPHFIREIRLHPSSVVLLDEIEKAHPNVLLTFMQVFDEGRLTDARGREIHCSDAIFILTSNLGAALPAKAKPQLGFRVEKDEPAAREREIASIEQQIRGAVLAALRPELVNRIQEVVVFRPLSREAIHQIINLYLMGINQRLEEREISVRLEESAKDLLAQAGYSEQFGARHLQRVFEQLIAEPLSREILSGNLKPGAEVHFRAEDGQFALEILNQQGTRTILYPPGDEGLTS